jgi:hypothetical protein
VRYDMDRWSRSYGRYDRGYRGHPDGGPNGGRIQRYSESRDPWGGFGPYAEKVLDSGYPPPPGLHGPARYGLGPYYERLRRAKRSDDDLRRDVEEALFFDTWVDSEAISVEVEDGVVTLRGNLPTYDEVRFATDDAWDTEGVVGVRSELTVSDR